MRRTRQQHQTFALRGKNTFHFLIHSLGTFRGMGVPKQLGCVPTRPLLLFFLAGFYSRRLHAQADTCIYQKKHAHQKITQHKYPVHHPTHTTLSTSRHANEKHGSRSPSRAKPPKNTPVSRVAIYANGTQPTHDFKHQSTLTPPPSLLPLPHGHAARLAGCRHKRVRAPGTTL